MHENETKGKMFDENIDDPGTISTRYTPLEKAMMIPVDGYHRKPVEMITATGKSMMGWIKEHAHEFPYEHCGFKVITLVGFDTDSAWVACKQCGDTRVLPSPCGFKTKDDV